MGAPLLPDLIRRIQYYHATGKSLRAIARLTGPDRRTVTRYCTCTEPPRPLTDGLMDIATFIVDRVLERQRESMRNQHKGQQGRAEGRITALGILPRKPGRKRTGRNGTEGLA